ncbi:hypothetical protein [Novipirellula artificiosorum]|nr:hypothetical protein [Novipirellula artificiosorum]
MRSVILFFLVLVCVPMSMKADSPPACPEDQMIAEALWSIFIAEPVGSVDASKAFERVCKAYPQSARVAYWKGRLGVYESNIEKTIELLDKTLQSVATISNSESAADQSWAKGRAAAMRSYARHLQQDLQERRQAMGGDSSSFEHLLLTAVQRDPMLISAWAALLDSSDQTIALAAADSWAQLEPHNALPLYAKAVIYTRGLKELSDPIDEKAIEAMEAGNSRSDCIAPEAPWPTGFLLTFPESVEKEMPGLSGNSVPEGIFRRAVEGRLFAAEAIGNWGAVASSSLRQLGSDILSRSHRLPIEQDIRHLRAFAGVGVHLANSNRLMYGLTIGSVERVLLRLETIAIDQPDFESGIVFFEIRHYLQDTVREVAATYRTELDQTKRAEKDALSAILDAKISDEDQRATEVMRSRAKRIAIPEIEIAETNRPKRIIGTDAANHAVDFIRLDVVVGKERAVHAHRLGIEFEAWFQEQIRQKGVASEKTSPSDLTSEELCELGIPTLQQQIAELRAYNRTHKRSLGILLCVRDDDVGQQIADDCYLSGYLGQRDPCIIAFDDAENLSEFQQFYEHLNLRVMLIPTDGPQTD